MDGVLVADALLGAITWPVLDRFDIGGLRISPHGLGIAAGYLLGSWWVLRLGPPRGMREEHLTSMLFWALVGTIVGSRLFYVIGHYDEFETVGEMLAIWEGGISLLGGMAGATLFALPLMRRYGYRFLQVMDLAAIGLPFGLFVGRIGDLIIGDHLGKPTNAPWAFAYSGGELAGYQCSPGAGCVSNLLGGEGGTITITEATARFIGPDGSVATGVGVHQTALYDFVSAFLLLMFMYLVMDRRPRREGVMILTFAVWYGSVRIFTDFLRVDKRFAGLTGSQWTSVVVVTVSLAVLGWWAIRKGPGPQARAPVAPEPAVAASYAFTPPAEPGRGVGGRSRSR